MDGAGDCFNGACLFYGLALESAFNGRIIAEHPELVRLRLVIDGRGQTIEGELLRLNDKDQLLAAELQALLDRFPQSVQEIILLAHWAGGLLANLAARQLHVPSGRRITVALLDPAWWPMLTLWPELARPEAYQPVPSGVAMTVYIAKEMPKPGSTLLPPSPVTATDLPQVYLGTIGHGPAVAHVALPLLASRRDRTPREAGRPVCR